MEIGISIAIALIVIILILVCALISTSNRLNRYLVTIEESKSTVDIALAKRYDVLSDLCAAVKKFTEHENDLIGQLVAVRKGGSIADTNAAIESQSQVLRQIYAIGESYPELRSSELYANLQKEVADQNEYLAAAKRTVNSNISQFNQLLVSFPSSMVANMKGCTRMDFLHEEDIENKRNASVKDML